ncbi:21279_t:CDS:2 [Cetraspora pellucida]|uniref:21279_t:CDS:1 n=1 Tax=Cetraspora pellucida TaxID=1433469 RepID=A0A9N9IG87_9GLOM|nr:21279_t:CDS:2 [Cetraspora pellucida]
MASTSITTQIVDFNNHLFQIDTLIIKETFMISGQLLTYFSELFESLHKNNNPFGGFHEFKNKTNLPETIKIQPDTRVMFLNNSQHCHRIANSTIGIITDLDLDLSLVYVNFCVEGAIINVSFSKYTSNFYINSIPASYTQFPIQNAFALTVHKTQGLTLPDVSLNLNDQIFAPGQAYIALSHCTR